MGRQWGVNNDLKRHEKKWRRECQLPDRCRPHGGWLCWDEIHTVEVRRSPAESWPPSYSKTTDISLLFMHGQKSFHSESHKLPRAKNTEAKTKTPIWKWNNYIYAAFEYFYLLFFLSTKRSRCSAHLRLTILTAYSWPVCLCLHLLQMEKLPSPSGGSWRHSS